MPRVETSLDRATKEAFRNLAKQSGTTEAALLRRVIATVVKSNPNARTEPSPGAARSMRLTVRVTPEIFEAVNLPGARTCNCVRRRVLIRFLRCVAY